jgi:hypothetical protein
MLTREDWSTHIPELQLSCIVGKHHGMEGRSATLDAKLGHHLIAQSAQKIPKLPS